MTVMLFAIKTFFTGVFLAWGFANGHILQEKAVEVYGVLKDEILAFFRTWPGLRNWLACLFAQAADQHQQFATSL